MGSWHVNKFYWVDAPVLLRFVGLAVRYQKKARLIRNQAGSAVKFYDIHYCRARKLGRRRSGRVVIKLIMSVVLTSNQVVFKLKSKDK